MAFDVSALSAYVDNEKFPLIANLQVSSKTAMLASKQVGIKGTSQLHYLESDVVFQDNDCTRTASGTTTMSDRSITVGDIAVHEDLCPKDLIGKWAQIELAQGALGDKAVPASVEEIYIAEKMSKLMEALEVADWQGDTASGTANLQRYDGWIKIIDAGSAINGNTSGTTAATGITAANVITLLQDMFLAQTKEIQAKANKSLFVPREVYNLYTIALVNANLYHFNAEGDPDTQLLFGTDIVIRPTDGLNGTDRMFLTYNENLVIGMDGDADEDNIEVRLDPVSNKNVFYDVEFKRGTQVYFTEHVVEFTLVP